MGTAAYCRLGGLLIISLLHIDHIPVTFTLDGRTTTDNVNARSSQYTVIRAMASDQSHHKVLPAKSADQWSCSGWLGHSVVMRRSSAVTPWLGAVIVQYNDGHLLRTYTAVQKNA